MLKSKANTAILHAGFDCPIGSMEARLKRLVEETEGQDDESESDVGKIVKIANYHLDSMKWIETQCQAIEEKIDQISKTKT